MTAEGWNGKSIREHVENAEAEAGRAVEEAGRALEIAEGFETRLDTLQRDLCGLFRPSAGQEIIDALPVSVAIPAVSEADRAALFCKVKAVRQEIEGWKAFMVEVRGVREAISEWRRLDVELLAPVSKGGLK